MMLGILVHGNNHYILRGPKPTEEEAHTLVRHWSLLQIGEVRAQRFSQWEIRNQEFRENLQWAVVVAGDRETSGGVVELLAELAARGVHAARYE